VLGRAILQAASVRKGDFAGRECLEGRFCRPRVLATWILRAGDFAGPQDLVLGKGILRATSDWNEAFDGTSVRKCNFADREGYERNLARPRV
jgi:hypothetical protein